MEAKKDGGIKKLVLIVVVLLIVLAALLFWMLNRGPRGTAHDLELGNLYLEQMDYEQAVIAFTAVIDVDPNNIDAYLGRARAYIGLENYEAAILDLEKVRELAPERGEEVDALMALIQAATAGEDGAGGGDGGDETLPVGARLTADQLEWLVEPTYAYDDVEPIWARDFSDMMPWDGEALSDGKDYLPDTWFAEMSFPQYSCLPQYYSASNGGTLRLFYMPDRVDSGDLAVEKAGVSCTIYDSTGILFNIDGRVAAGTMQRDDGTLVEIPAPWNVMTSAERGGSDAVLVWDEAGEQAYMADMDWSVVGPGVICKPVAELALHKPYPILRGSMDYDAEFGDTYVNLTDVYHYAFANPAGELITDFVYEDTGTFSNGLAPVCRDGKWGYIDENGNAVTELIYDGVWETQVEDTEYISDANGVITDVIYTYYKEGYPCTSDTMVVSKDGQMGVLYRDGSLLIDFGQYEDLAPAWNDQLWAKQDGKWGLIDLAAAKALAGLQ